MSSRLDSARRLADYAAAFDFLDRFAGATTEEAVIENVFDLFMMLFVPSTMIHLPVRNGEPGLMTSRSSVPFDAEAARESLLRLDTEHSWAPSGNGFDMTVGRGPSRDVVRVDGIRFVGDRDHYLNLALSVRPVLSLALTNARSFQQLRDEEEKLRSAIRARDMILAVVSHDLRNPLASIGLSAGALERSCRCVADQRACHSIVQSVRRMSRLIDDLVDIGRIEAGVLTVQTTECVPEEVCRDALEELRPQAETRGVRLEQKCHASASLKCDRDRIMQLLSNLAGNALKFVPERGGAITIECTERGDEVVFAVRDNGRGIRPEELSHVFDIYWQGREKRHLGTGLGLAIARGIVEAHGGRIWVHSVFGEGATFFFTIPRSRGGA